MAEPEKKELGGNYRRIIEGIHAEANEAPKKTEYIGEYIVKDGDTLTHIALKYYGNPNREYWMLIYEANKDVIGDSYKIIRTGMVFKIPALPDELKKK